VGLWDAVTGRRRVRGPNLDALFNVPTAAITLEASSGFRPTGTGSVCFRAPAGAAYHETQTEIIALIDDDDETPEGGVTRGESGVTWLTVPGDPGDMSALCTDLHAVNRTLGEQGFDSGLLCTVVPFADPTGRRFGLVYLYRSGTFYAFAPVGENARDNLLEIQVRDTLAPDLPMERDLSRWLALWGAPGV
jgi:hypothetical protein